MNYIKQLQSEIADNADRADRAQEFRAYLQTSKFGPQADGSRGDWIATADVLRWLQYIETAF
jgi:hypothetical protein